MSDFTPPRITPPDADLARPARKVATMAAVTADG
jgi:hypothetical protein